MVATGLPSASSEVPAARPTHASNSRLPRFGIVSVPSRCTPNRYGSGPHRGRVSMVGATSSRRYRPGSSITWKAGFSR